MNNQHFANEHNFIGKLLKILLYVDGSHMRL